MGAQKWEDVRDSVKAFCIGGAFTAATMFAASLVMWPEFWLFAF